MRIAQRILKEIRERLGFLRSVGLQYLTLSRSAATLSGGESQRIRLATQIGSSLMGVLYILDEPSIGLHQRDNDMLLETMKHLRDLGNTLLVVEHDEDTMRAADYHRGRGPRRRRPRRTRSWPAAQRRRSWPPPAPSPATTSPGGGRSRCRSSGGRGTAKYLKVLGRGGEQSAAHRRVHSLWGPSPA